MQFYVEKVVSFSDITCGMPLCYIKNDEIGFVVVKDFIKSVKFSDEWRSCTDTNTDDQGSWYFLQT